MDRTSTFRGASAYSVVVGTLVVLVDQATKAVWAGSVNREFHLGAFSGPRLVMVAMMAAVLGLVVLYLPSRAPDWAVGLIAGGVASNLIDRALHEGVRDFIPGHWIVFNVADVAVFVGLAAWLVSSTRRR